MDKKSAYSIESEIVNEKFIKRKDTYNMAIGGNGGNTSTGKTHSNKTKHKMKLSALLTSEDRSKRMSNIMSGRTYTNEINSKKASKGSSNGNARKIVFEDDNGNIIDSFFGDFKKKCTEKKYPFSVMSKALRSSSKSDILYINSKYNSIKEEYRKYIGYKIYYI